MVPTVPEHRSGNRAGDDARRPGPHALREKKETEGEVRASERERERVSERERERDAREWRRT